MDRFKKKIKVGFLTREKIVIFTQMISNSIRHLLKLSLKTSCLMKFNPILSQEFNFQFNL